jgi:hypothetical protein
MLNRFEDISDIEGKKKQFLITVVVNEQGLPGAFFYLLEKGMSRLNIQNEEYYWKAACQAVHGTQKT